MEEYSANKVRERERRKSEERQTKLTLNYTKKIQWFFSHWLMLKTLCMQVLTNVRGKCGSEKDIYSIDQLEGIDGGKNHTGHRKDMCMAW